MKYLIFGLLFYANTSNAQSPITFVPTFTPEGLAKISIDTTAKRSTREAPFAAPTPPSATQQPAAKKEPIVAATPPKENVVEVVTSVGTTVLGVLQAFGDVIIGIAKDCLPSR